MTRYRNRVVTIYIIVSVIWITNIFVQIICSDRRKLYNIYIKSRLSPRGVGRHSWCLLATILKHLFSFTLINRCMHAWRFVVLFTWPFFWTSPIWSDHLFWHFHTYFHYTKTICSSSRTIWRIDFQLLSIQKSCSNIWEMNFYNQNDCNEI